MRGGRTRTRGASAVESGEQRMATRVFAAPPQLRRARFTKQRVTAHAPATPPRSRQASQKQYERRIRPRGIFTAEKGDLRLRRTTSSALHRLEELRVRLGILQLVQQKLHRRQFVHGVQHLPQHPHLLQLVRLSQQLLLAGAGPIDVY